MNICIVAKYYFVERIGGAEVQAWLLACELAARGHQVSYVCESLGGREGTTETIDGVHVHWLKNRRYFPILSMPHYARALRRIRPEVVLHRYTSGYEAALGRYCKRHGAKFVWICTDDASPVRRYFHKRHSAGLLRKRRSPLARLVLWAHAKALDMSREYGMQFVTHPCVQNAAQKALFKEHFGRTAFNFPSGHKIPDTLPSKPDTPPIVLWVAGFGAGKRPELFAQLAKLCSGLGACFVMVSKRFGRDTHISPEDIYATAGEGAAFEWHIDLPLKETLAWFDRASVFVNTSVSENEGFPNTFVQAWSRGVPIVSLDVNPDGILDREGLGDRTGSLEGARDAIEKYLTGPNLAATRQHLQDYARAHFSIAGVADHLLDILDRKPDSLRD